MNTKTFGAVLGVLVVTTVLVALMSSFSSFTSAANVTEQNTSSTANVSYYIAIGMSTELINGINFGAVEPLTYKNNASKDYTGASSGSEYWVTISEDGNTNVSISIKDDANLTSSLSSIPNTGYFWNATNTNTTSATVPGLNGTAITAGYVSAVSTIGKGTSAYFRFWLDVPSGQAAGNYNNTVFFQAAKV